MPQRVSFTDLLSEPREVQFEHNGPWYKLPGDIPLPMIARIEEFAKEEHTADEVMSRLRDDAVELFHAHNPKIDSWEKLPCTMLQLVLLVRRVYADTDDDEQQPPEPDRSDPTGRPRTSRGAKRSTSRTAKSRR